MIRFLLTISFLIPATGNAFTLLSENLHGWRGRNLEFKINMTSCDDVPHLEGALSDALDLWNSVATSYLKIDASGDVNTTTSSNPPVLRCDPAFGTGDTAGADIDSIPGAGLPQVSNDRIQAGQLILNIAGGDADVRNMGRKALAIVLAHEIGHVLGLGHSEDSTSLMYYAANKSDLTLSQDDMDGITYLYGRDEFSSDLPFACGSVQAPAGSGPRGGMWILFIPVAALILIRLRLGFSRHLA